MEKFDFTSIIRLTAGPYTLYCLDHTYVGCSTFGRPGRFEDLPDGIIMQFEIDSFQGHGPDATQFISAPQHTHTILAMRPTSHVRGHS